MGIRLDNIMDSLTIAIRLSEKGVSKNFIEYVHGISSKVKATYKDHARSVTFIALNIANSMGVDDGFKKDLYIASYLHDLGLSKVNFKASEEDILRLHCEEGARLIERIPHIKHLSEFVKYHHENLDGTGPFKLEEKEIPLISHIIKISGALDVVCNIKCEYDRNKSMMRLFDRFDIIVSKKIIDNLYEILSNSDFWEILKSKKLIDKWMLDNKPIIDDELTEDEFEQVAEIYAEIIDTRSVFTLNHSRGIAELAYKIGKHKNYGEYKSRRFRVAALLHDIGKLAIEDKYIYKNGKLSEDEFNIVKQHAEYTYKVLSPIKGIEDLIEWAISHHEKLDGSGYFRELTHLDLGEEQRLLTICDIYQALTEDRPYRIKMSREKAFEILDVMVKEKKICPYAYSDLKSVL